MTNKSDTLLDESLMLDAASGAAPPAVQLLAACHAEMNSEAAARLTAMEAVFGAMLEQSCGDPVSPELYEETVTALDQPAKNEAPGSKPVSAWPALPVSLRGVLHDNAASAWRKRLGGVSEIVLDDLCEPDVHVRLLKLPKGAKAPEHTHGGDELTLVLSGAFRDEAGRYAVGDVCHAPSGHMHRPVVDGNEDCLCLAVEFGPLHITNPVLWAAGALFGRAF